MLNTIVNAESDLGKLTANAQAVCGTILGITLIIIGIFILRSPPSSATNHIHTVKLPSEVIATTPTSLTVSYTIGTIKKQKTFQMKTNSSIGSKIDLYYNPLNEEDIQVGSDATSGSDATFGLILIIAGVLIPLCLIYNAYIVNHNKIAAVGSGIRETEEIIRSLFQ
jgi:hypothetical protein